MSSIQGLENLVLPPILCFSSVLNTLSRSTAKSSNISRLMNGRGLVWWNYYWASHKFSGAWFGPRYTSKEMFLKPYVMSIVGGLPYSWSAESYALSSPCSPSIPLLALWITGFFRWGVPTPPPLLLFSELLRCELVPNSMLAHSEIISCANFILLPKNISGVWWYKSQAKL